MRALVTGGAGFIGSHLCDRLLGRGAQVCCLDNLYLGTRRNIAHLESAVGFRFVEGDVLDRTFLEAFCLENDFDAIFHMAANSDIPAGTTDSELDLRLNFQTTANILDMMRRRGFGRIFFPSTSAVFGEKNSPFDENSGPLQPISFYGASKLAAEAYLSAHAHLSEVQAVILRFPNVVGERATHGVIFDFLRKLERNRRELEVLGDGSQTKPYLYVGDLVDAIFVAWDKTSSPFAVYHAAGVGLTSVREIAEIVVAAAGDAETRIRYTGGDRGWPGDVPKFEYDTTRLQALGWQPLRHSTDAVRLAVARILANGF